MNIESDIHELVILDSVFAGLKSVMGANPMLFDRNPFPYWVHVSYAKTMAIGIRRQIEVIRRQIEVRTDVITLGRLLDEMNRSAHFITRDYYFSLFNKPSEPWTEIDKEVLRLEFEKFSGKVKTHIDPLLVLEDLTSLKLNTQNIKRYVNKRVAHWDSMEFRDYPTYEDLRKALEFLKVVFRKYYRLLYGPQKPMIAQPTTEWLDIFKIPWIKSESNVNMTMQEDISSPNTKIDIASLVDQLLQSYDEKVEPEKVEEYIQIFQEKNEPLTLENLLREHNPAKARLLQVIKEVVHTKKVNKSFKIKSKRKKRMQSPRMPHIPIGGKPGWRRKFRHR